MKSGVKNVPASVLARLRIEAREKQVPFNQILQFYAMERFLYRLSKSPHADGVLLKGALLLKTIGIPRARPTMDIDLLRQGKGDRDSLIDLVRECVLIKDEMDGVTFDSTNILVEDIAKDAEYLGTRVMLKGHIGNVRLNVQIDFGIGDVVSPGPRIIEYPTFLNQPPVRLQAYPIEAAIAEKFQAMVSLDFGNSRMKDFYDIWTCAGHLEFDGETLANSIAATFAKRATPLPVQPPLALTPEFSDAHVHQVQWKAFARKILEPEIADSFGEVAGRIAGFLMPPTIAVAQEKEFRRHWRRNFLWESL